jgi:ATP-dependent DNA helicase PIF1
MTLDKICCDLWQVFEKWQIYVALSRVKSLEWLFLVNFNPKKIFFSEKVVDFYKNLT